MRLTVYSSVEGKLPNLVSLQDEALDFLPTVLVCPLKEGVPVTLLRNAVVWQERNFVAMCELARPIRRTALRRLGLLDEQTSHDIMRKFLSLLAR